MENKQKFSRDSLECLNPPWEFCIFYLHTVKQTRVSFAVQNGSYEIKREAIEGLNVSFKFSSHNIFILSAMFESNRISCRSYKDSSCMLECCKSAITSPSPSRGYTLNNDCQTSKYMAAITEHVSMAVRQYSNTECFLHSSCRDILSNSSQLFEVGS
jgi:hypothetical protein